MSHPPGGESCFQLIAVVKYEIESVSSPALIHRELHLAGRDLLNCYNVGQ